MHRLLHQTAFLSVLFGAAVLDLAAGEAPRWRGHTTAAVFRECYGMDWPRACAEMRAYLKPKNLGMLEVRMPHVMADVPEVERMEFRDATLDEVRRIIGDLNRLRIGRAAQRMPTSEPPDMERSLSLRGAELSGNPAGSNKGQK